MTNRDSSARKREVLHRGPRPCFKQSRHVGSNFNEDQGTSCISNAQESALVAVEMHTQAERLKGFVKELAAVLNGTGNGFISQKRSFQTVKNATLLAASKIFSGRGNRQVPIASSPKAKRTGLTAVPRQREIRPEQIIPLEDDFKEF